MANTLLAESSPFKPSLVIYYTSLAFSSKILACPARWALVLGHEIVSDWGLGWRDSDWKGSCMNAELHKSGTLTAPREVSETLFRAEL